MYSVIMFQGLLRHVFDHVCDDANDADACASRDCSALSLFAGLFTACECDNGCCVGHMLWCEWCCQGSKYVGIYSQLVTILGLPLR